MLEAILTACVLLAAGLALRQLLPPLRVLYVPASVVAGLLGFGLIEGLRHVPAAREATTALAADLASWPGPLIAVVFAGLLLQRSGKTFGEAMRRGARSGALAWIIILGQVVIGLLIYATAVAPRYEGVPATFGQLPEISWSGGHGSSAGMAGIYEAQGFPQGRDLAFFLATCGLVYGVVSGLVFVNVAVRRGWVKRMREWGDTRAEARVPVPLAYGRVDRAVMEPMALQIIILAAAFGTGLLLQAAFVRACGFYLSGETLAYIDKIPLFLFTLLGGWIVREAMHGLRIAHLIDGPSIDRLLGVAIEFLIVAAVATMRTESLASFALPIALLLAGAAAWSAFCLFVVAPRLLPRAYWFELGLLNYGFSTANTPQGFMLLRIVDPELKSGAAEDCAVAAPLSAPFVGGGIVTSRCSRCCWSARGRGR